VEGDEPFAAASTEELLGVATSAAEDVGLQDVEPYLLPGPYLQSR